MARLRLTCIPPEWIAEGARQIRQSARSRLVQFDTHRTRQIAAKNGSIVRVSRGGSFSIKNDWPFGFD